VKRKLLERDRSFDEAELGFSKFSLFLDQAAEHGVIGLGRTETGNFQVSLPGGGAAEGGDEDQQRERGRDRGRREAESRERPPRQPEEREEDEDEDERGMERPRETASAPVASLSTDSGSGRGSDDAGGQTVLEMDPSEMDTGGKRLGPRRGSTRRRGGDEPPPLFEGQVVRTPGEEPHHGSGEPDAGGDHRTGDGVTRDRAAATSDFGGGNGEGPRRGDALDAQALGLPTDQEAIIRYMANRYRGVGEKTAEVLVERFGNDVFQALRDDPEAVREAVAGGRAEKVLEAWEADYERRMSRRSRS